MNFIDYFTIEEIKYFQEKYNVDITSASKLLTSKNGILAIIDFLNIHKISELQGKEILNIKNCGHLATYKKKFGIVYHRGYYKKPKITKEQVLNIIKESIDTNTPEKEIAKRYDVNNLQYYKKKYNIPTHPIGNAPCTARTPRKYNVNDNFFKELTLLNCYYGGFLAADGNVFNHKLTIGLSSKDDKWMEDFKKSIEFEGELHHSIVRDRFPYTYMTVSSSEIVNDLNQHFNIVPNKSLILKHPNITDDKFKDYFICGYIDGDGSISLTKNGNKQKRLVISLLGTKDMCLWIKEHFEKKFNKESLGTISHDKSHHKNIFSYNIGDVYARKIFIEYYKLDIPKLERKWTKERYEYCINYKKRLPICRRKGVYVYDLNGNKLTYFDTLEEAQKYTKVDMSRISVLCKLNTNTRMTNGFMFSREDKQMDAYIPHYTLKTKDISMYNEEYYKNFLKECNNIN